MKILGTVLLLLSITTLIFFFVNSPLKSSIQHDMERAYFEGQKDAINGDIRIMKNQDSCYIWKKSPWDSGTPPVYWPTYEESRH